MLIEFKVQNYSSFNTQQTLSMLASRSTKEDFNVENTIPVNKFGIKNIIKSAVVFGANASGKSNLIKSILALKKIVLDSFTTAKMDNLSSVIPFLIKEDLFDEPIEFEVSFLFEQHMYRYGIAISEAKIQEEWLYWRKTTKETMLFHRIGQTVEINRRSFSEAKDFIRKENNVQMIEKTRADVPFVAVLSQFDGEKSQKVVNWFKKIKDRSNRKDKAIYHKSYTIALLDENEQFKKWALSILAAIQIQDVYITESEGHPLEDYTGTDANIDEEIDEEIDAALTHLKQFLDKSNFKEKKVEVVKTQDAYNKNYVIPLSLESEGTRKLFGLLGPIFTSIQKGEILLIDEFDNDFHTLLSKFILDVFQKNSKSSQLLITCHDTHLLNKELLRRDQIWFVEKNKHHESELYSLLEYKEYYARKGDSYSRDYLEGRYGAIPLFDTVNEVDLMFDE